MVERNHKYNRKIGTKTKFVIKKSKKSKKSLECYTAITYMRVIIVV